MDPCGHTCCGGCLDQWMSQKSSFAQTLRNGSSDTTCPLCRAAVTDTVAATPVEGVAAAALRAAPPSEAEDEVKDWMALARQRHAEVVAKARAMRGDLSVSDERKRAASARDAGPHEAEPTPSNRRRMEYRQRAFERLRQVDTMGHPQEHLLGRRPETWGKWGDEGVRG